ncbi:MAG TPA: ABC transporter permease [Solirubrobacteraceae bacterium]|nr:ABC transporter permease [Solirubrobacteraceae bacterium]
MSARRAIWEVARRELVERSRSRVLRISLVVLVLLSGGGAVAAARLGGHTPTDHVGLVGTRSEALAPAIRLQAKAAGRNVRLRKLPNAAAARRAVRDGSVDLALLDGNRVLVKHSGASSAVRVVRDAVATRAVLARLRRAGLSEGRALAALAPRALPTTVLEPRPRNYDRDEGLIVIGMLALFMMLVFFGQALAQSVTEEKSSRVVELLLTTVPPRHLLAGKVLGVGLLGLALLFVPSLAALAAGNLAGGVGLPSAAPEAVALILLWFVLGYVLYSVAFAAVGALVSRQEDLNTAMLPVNAVLIVAFYLALFVVNDNPNGTLARVAAFVPPLSPMLVPARVVLGDMTVLGLAAAVALDLLATVGIVVLAGRAYERAILRIGAPLKLRRLLRPDTARQRAAASGTRQVQRARHVEPALRAGAVALLLAGVLVGFGDPLGIALATVGLLLVLAVQGRGRLHRRHR